jgi:hypothetical protein
MRKVYQGFVDKDKGDCMRAVIASLLDKDLLDVPNFIEEERWFDSMWKFFKEEGYEYHGMLHNNPAPDVIAEYHISALKDHPGIDGLFFASVYSPKYFSMDDYTEFGTSTTHAVIIDKDFNIVHDPNPGNTSVEKYPMADTIGFNGVLHVWLIEKKK